VIFCFIAETEEIFCNFEEKCAFEDDFTATEPWTYRAVQSRTKWDNTLNIRTLTYFRTCSLQKSVCRCVREREREREREGALAYMVC